MPEPEVLLRFSSLQRLIRVTAWIRRWRPQCSNQDCNKSETSGLSAEELNAAHDLWIRMIQEAAFRPELEAISKDGTVSGRSQLRRLSPFLDDKGILRVGGRIKHAVLTNDQRHPIILPVQSHFTYLVIEAYHCRTLHGGAQLTSIRQLYWIPSGRQRVKRQIHRCVPCARWRTASPQPFMGSLPRRRVSPGRLFQHTGVDFAGPIYLRTSKGHEEAYKAFLAVFICCSFRAVHLEAVSDYNADAFLAAFRRFVSHRGLCEVIYSDRGTGGADSQLRSLFRQAGRDADGIAGCLAGDGIRWQFNLPAAPHFGGLWEAAIKSMKHDLRRVIGETTLTFEEMATLLAISSKVEA